MTAIKLSGSPETSSTLSSIAPSSPGGARGLCLRVGGGPDQASATAKLSVSGVSRYHDNHTSPGFNLNSAGHGPRTSQISLHYLIRHALALSAVRTMSHIAHKRKDLAPNGPPKTLCKGEHVGMVSTVHKFKTLVFEIMPHRTTLPCVRWPMLASLVLLKNPPTALVTASVICLG